MESQGFLLTIWMQSLSSCYAFSSPAHPQIPTLDIYFFPPLFLYLSIQSTLNSDHCWAWGTPVRCLEAGWGRRVTTCCQKRNCPWQLYGWGQWKNWFLTNSPGELRKRQQREVGRLLGASCRARWVLSKVLRESGRPQQPPAHTQTPLFTAGAPTSLLVFILPLTLCGALHKGPLLSETQFPHM